MTPLAIFDIVVLAALAALFAQMLMNLRAIPRLSAFRSRVPNDPAASRSVSSIVPPRVSVLIPARNEAERIIACVAAWREQRYASYEVLIYDDQSTDDTAARARQAARGAAHVRVIGGSPLPDGWRGKTHACHRLRESARGSVLVFSDADVVPEPTALACTMDALAALAADALSALPSHASDHVMLGALASIQNWAALTLIPLWLPWARCRPAFAAMNGQFIAISAAVYDASGGFAAVANSLGEDTALGRRLVGLGYRVRLADGADLLTCCAYTRLADLWRANVRNMTAVLFGSPWALLGSAFGLATVYVAPFALLVIALAFGRAGSTAWTLLPAIACALAIGARALVERRSGHAAWTALLHPFTMAALVAMQLDAGCRTRARGSVEWRGRRYPISADVA